MRGAELWGLRCRPKPIQYLWYRRGRAGNSPRASFETAAHRVLAFWTTGVLSCIRVRNGGGLAIRRHQGGHSRECDHRSLQADGEHHNESDELTLHDKNNNTRPAFGCLRLARAEGRLVWEQNTAPQVAAQ
jgi:hypothetical protein